MSPAPSPSIQSDLIVTTGNDIAGYKITQYLGVVRGIVVRSTGIARGITGSLRSIVGGNIPEYAAVCEEARQRSYSIMAEHAGQMEADAVIAFRYDATEFVEGVTEVLAYGTGVKITKSQQA
jgi:uncharacterized protein YbjQ (UPF0145 family)